MKSYRIVLFAVMGLGTATFAWSDQIKTRDKEKQPYKGRITSMNALEVEIELSNSMTEKVPANEILWVAYEENPTQFVSVNKHIREGDYAAALDILERDEGKSDRREIVQEIGFLKAFCAARLALGGSGPVADAGRMMLEFLNKNPKSYHYFEGCGLLGNLLAANGSYAEAQKYFDKMADAPWPEYKLRAQVALGQAQLAQRKYAEASKAFDAALGGEGTGEAAELQRLTARLGKIRCLAAQKRADEAVKQAEEIVAKADAENTELNANAYNTLGTALRAAGRKQDAMLAFLHVDLLYSAVPAAHAEALANLAELFRDKDIRKPAHAARVEEKLKQRYKDSPWAAKVRE